MANLRLFSSCLTTCVLLLSLGVCSGIGLAFAQLRALSDTRFPVGNRVSESVHSRKRITEADDADTTTVAPQQTSTAYVEQCADFVDGEVSCTGIELQGFCTQEPDYARLICAKTCGFCQPCEDNVDAEISCDSLSLQGFCQNEPVFASVICPKTCGMCGQVHGIDVLATTTAPPATTTPRPTTTIKTTVATTPHHTTRPTTTPPPTTTVAASTCQDNTGGGLPCDQLAGVCATAFAQTLCPKFCNFCS